MIYVFKLGLSIECIHIVEAIVLTFLMNCQCNIVWPYLEQHQKWEEAPLVSAHMQVWIGSPTGSLCHTASFHSSLQALQKSRNAFSGKTCQIHMGQIREGCREMVIRGTALISGSLTAGRCMLSLLSVSEACSAPFLRGSTSCSPFSSSTAPADGLLSPSTGGGLGLSAASSIEDWSVFSYQTHTHLKPILN